MTKVTLDDVVGAGKKAKATDSYKVRFEEAGGSLNAALDVAGIDGMDRYNPAGYAALAAHSADMAPARQRSYLEGFANDVFAEVVGATQPKMRAAIEGIKPEILRPYVLSRKVVKYKGADQEVLDAHESAAKAQKVLSDEGELRKASGAYENKLLDATKKNSLKGAVAWVLKNNPGVGIGAVQKEAAEKLKKFNDLDGDRIASYVFGRYGALNNKDKAAEAYEIAKALADSQ